MAVKISKKLIGYNRTAKKRSKTDIKHIVVHYVGALGDAKANVDYYGGGNRNASADFFVGHTGDVWQAVDYYNYYSWHCGGGVQGSGHTFYGKCTNSNSVGIEMCVKKRSTKTMNATDKDWYFTDATIESTAQLIAQLMQELDIDIDHVIRHYDVVGKICPNPFVYDTGSVSWSGFKKKVQGYHSGASGKRKMNSDMTYTVAKGDTLAAIAKDFTDQGSKITVNYLKKWNKLTSDKITVGQKLKFYYGKIEVTKKAAIRTGALSSKKKVGSAKVGKQFYQYGSKTNVKGNKWYKVWWTENGVPKMRYLYSKKSKKI